MPKRPWQPYKISAPHERKLKVYAFDPAIAARPETTAYGVVTLSIAYEPLRPGPVGERLEVIDDDPETGCYYEPVDLDNPNLISQDGLEPSEGNPLFHQQMCYAVAMSTVLRFEHALGRQIWWKPVVVIRDKKKKLSPKEAAFANILNGAKYEGPEALPNFMRQLESYANENGGWSFVADKFGFVPRLRMYPHGLRQRNAYYDPDRRTVTFGYFTANTAKSKNYLPGGIVFTCLSHDVISHEVTHAMLDATSPKLLHASNDDVFAFHEAFADIVAIFQRFQMRDVVASQIAASRGDISDSNSLLDKLAMQFGLSTGQPGALRAANKDTDVNLIDTVFEPHQRGNLLVTAVYDAFLSIYDSRIADLRRIASDGSGILRPGSLHPDLVQRLTTEAIQLSQAILNICVRALDYLPPVDVNFGDFLRAIVTADADLIPKDTGHYRRAIVDAFRLSGIYPSNVQGLGEDSAHWQREKESDVWKEGADMIRAFASAVAYRETSSAEMFSYGAMLRIALHHSLGEYLKKNPDMARRFGLLPPSAEIPFEIEGVFPVERVGPDGQKLRHFIVRITQKCRIDLTTDQIDDAKCEKIEYDSVPDVIKDHDLENRTVIVRGGSTLIFDGVKGDLVYSIRKNISNQDRWTARKTWEKAKRDGRPNTVGTALSGGSPFAFLHRDRADFNLNTEITK